MAKEVVLKRVVAQSTFDYIKQKHGADVWDRLLAGLDDHDRIAITAGGNVPLDSMGRFNEVFVDQLCRGSKTMAQQEFRQMGAESADKLLTGGGIFSIFARLLKPKQVLARAESVIKTAYPGVSVEVVVADDEGGGIIRMHGMAGYPYGSQRIVGWLLRGIEIVGGENARVKEMNWDAGQIDSDTYEFAVGWDGWR